MTATLEPTREILHDAYAAAAKAMSIRPEPVILRSRDHASARARAVVWWVLTRSLLIPCDTVAALAGFSSSNIRHSAAIVSNTWSINEERVKDKAIAAIHEALNQHTT